jgi:hypothetical protein
VSFEYPPSGLVADHASETRGSYDDPKTRKKNTRTSTHAINDACHQVAIATQAIVHEEQSKLLGRPESMQTVMTFMPLIVTTARLHVLEFDPSKVSAETGEIPRKDARLKPVQALQYLYPIPRHLQFGGGPKVPWYQLMKLPISIVNSRHFRDFLSGLASYHGFYK